MMECAKIKKMLPDYSVGNISKRKRNFINQHIESCPDCMQELKLLNSIGSYLDAIPQEESPSFLWQGIENEIANQNTSKSSSWQKTFQWLWKERIPAFVTSFGILILLAGLYFFVWKSPTELEHSNSIEAKQQLLSNWNSPFADRVALGMLVMKSEIGDEKNEKSR